MLSENYNHVWLHRQIIELHVDSQNFSATPRTSSTTPNSSSISKLLPPPVACPFVFSAVQLQQYGKYSDGDWLRYANIPKKDQDHLNLAVDTFLNFPLSRLPPL